MQNTPFAKCEWGWGINSSSFDVRVAAMAFFASCSPTERAPFIHQIGAMLHDERADVQTAVMLFFASCSREERADFVGQIGTMLQDGGPVDVRIAAISVLATFSPKERAPFLQRIGDLLLCESHCETPAACLDVLQSSSQDTPFVMRAQNYSWHPAHPVTSRAFRMRELCDMPISSAALLFFASCSIEERAPFMGRISKLLDGQYWQNSIGNICLDQHAQIAAINFFGMCTFQEQQPIVDKIGELVKAGASRPAVTLLENRCRSPECTAEERKLYQSWLDEYNAWLQSQIVLKVKGEVRSAGSFASSHVLFTKHVGLAARRQCILQDQKKHPAQEVDGRILHKAGSGPGLYRISVRW